MTHARPESVRIRTARATSPRAVRSAALDSQVLSDSDVVWLRDPRPYLRALEVVHPRMDFAVSTDSQAREIEARSRGDRSQYLDLSV